MSESTQGQETGFSHFKQKQNEPEHPGSGRNFRKPGKLDLEPRRAQTARRAGAGVQQGLLLTQRGPPTSVLLPRLGPGVRRPRPGVKPEPRCLSLTRGSSSLTHSLRQVTPEQLLASEGAGPSKPLEPSSSLLPPEKPLLLSRLPGAWACGGGGGSPRPELGTGGRPTAAPAGPEPDGAEGTEPEQMARDAAHKAP